MVSLGDFKKTILISVIGHITALGIFSLSFGHIIPRADYAGVFFLGSILHKPDLSSQPFIINARASGLPKPLALEGSGKEYLFVPLIQLKPKMLLPLNGDKIIFTPGQEMESVSLVAARKESVIMFYPALPYHFLLYFKDRRTVHIELMFNIIPAAGTNSISIKRKISSGNLEVDLLAMRYIRHYLFIQQKGFSLGEWQTVKIDLVPPND